MFEESESVLGKYYYLYILYETYMAVPTPSLDSAETWKCVPFY